MDTFERKHLFHYLSKKTRYAEVDDWIWKIGAECWG
jgi:hypothetical protein